MRLGTSILPAFGGHIKFLLFRELFPFRVQSLIILMQTGATGFDRSFWRPTDAMPGYLMQLVKKRREKTIANNNELALAA